MNSFLSTLLSFDMSVIYNTWAVLISCIILSKACAYWAHRSDTVLGYASRAYVRFFMDMVEQSCGPHTQHFTRFIASLFSFILLCNYIALIPGLHEPTENINTTLALSIMCFFYTNYQAIVAHGIKEYIKEYFQPFFLLFPLHVLGKLSNIVSLACRLFGNIYGGTIIMSMLKLAVSGSIILQLLFSLSGITLLVTLFFVLFEGLIQAFVFSILTLTYISMAVSHEDI